jgi:hypothetical protein
MPYKHSFPPLPHHSWRMPAQHKPWTPVLPTARQEPWLKPHGASSSRASNSLPANLPISINGAEEQHSAGKWVAFCYGKDSRFAPTMAEARVRAERWSILYGWVASYVALSSVGCWGNTIPAAISYKIDWRNVNGQPRKFRFRRR